MYLIIGNYLNTNIQIKRKLPISNPAGSNRILGLAKAINSTNRKVIVLSPANAASIKFSWKIIHNKEATIEGNIPILFSSTIAFPVISSLLEMISIPLSFLSLRKKEKIAIK